MPQRPTFQARPVLQNCFGTVSFEVPARRIGIERPPLSPDLSPSDYILWDTLEDTVIWNNLATLDEFEELICGACALISVVKLQRVTEISFSVCAITVLRKV
ncbi:hypothetical protein AVEN_78697-1 [Araneus ventricosus]|uniref:Uncharacterized protein n=1 Tax=Araneus ventricosus TaxID=182803 RepID=A0A4Y2JB67_ARAVE|nr:hypothetical protein AVEN_78697-1 [Araneus ventricosus]